MYSGDACSASGVATCSIDETKKAAPRPDTFRASVGRGAARVSLSESTPLATDALLVTSVRIPVQRSTRGFDAPKFRDGPSVAGPADRWDTQGFLIDFVETVGAPSWDGCGRINLVTSVC